MEIAEELKLYKEGRQYWYEEAKFARKMAFVWQDAATFMHERPFEPMASLLIRLQVDSPLGLIAVGDAISEWAYQKWHSKA